MDEAGMGGGKRPPVAVPSSLAKPWNFGDTGFTDVPREVQKEPVVEPEVFVQQPEYEIPTSVPRSDKTRIDEDDIAHIATQLGCSMSIVKAVIAVESSRDSFIPGSQFPIVKSEPHVFHKVTRGRFDRFPELSQPTFVEAKKKWCRGSTKNRLNCEKRKFEMMMQLDEEAAVKSCSWGALQIMGFNHENCGYKNWRDFHDDMYSVEGQVRAFLGFVKNNPRLHRAFIEKDYDTIALIYNGSRALEEGYDDKIEEADIKAAKEYSKKVSMHDGRYANTSAIGTVDLGGSVTATLAKGGAAVIGGAGTMVGVDFQSIVTDIQGKLQAVQKIADDSQAVKDQLVALQSTVDALAPSWYSNPVLMLALGAGVAFGAIYLRRWYDWKNGR